ncbi:hypothetical protein GGI42DRAFT_333230, partial [Trichoderma sp. SZMC 28013]
MFKLSRRRDHSLQPLTKETADPNAATAAASAFMRGNPAPSSSLSSAAAAAALRAQPSPPTNVAQVSSKRSQRRTASLSSPIGRDRGKSKLHRSPSVSSMSERTFRRSPSPGHTPLGKQDVPPVPTIPASKAVTMPLRTQNFQTASQKSRGNQQGSWFGAATIHDAYQEKGTEVLPELTPDLPESRSGSVSSSINFSYPRARIAYDSHMTPDQDLVYDPNSRRMVSRDALVQASHPIEGTKPTEKAKPTKPIHQDHIPQEQHDEIKPVIPNDIQPEPFAMTTSQSHATGRSLGRRSPNDDTLMPTMATETLSQEREPEAEGSRDWQNQNASQNEASEFVTEPSLTSGLANWDSTKTEIPISYAGSGSETSVRSAHFASSTDQLVVKHEPPPRSLSPRKSALKSAISSRGSQSSHPNENTDYQFIGTSHFSKDDSTASHKKSARVSWNDNGTVVVAEPGNFEGADFSAVHGLQSRHNTQGTVDSAKANRTSSPQQDELMSPRPALPLFGSVRDKKGKEPEERQLVRPREPSLSPQPLPPASSQTLSSTTKDEIPSPIESTKVFHYGRGQTPRNVANISKYREPLPAIIASTESLGHVSEDMYSSGDELFEDVSTGTEQSMAQKSSKDVSANSSPLSDVLPDENSKASDAKALKRSPDIYSSNSDPPAIHHDISPTTEPNSLPGSFPEDEDVSRLHIDDANSSVTPVLAQASGYKTGNQEEHDSDMDSIYSDAYEDLSEAGDDGFMSLDAALVSSPMAGVDSNKSRINASTGGKPLENTTRTPIQSPDDWEKAKAYWKSLSSEERRQLEMEALREADDEAIRERVSTKRTATLADVSDHSPNSEQRSQRQQSQKERLLRTAMVSPDEARQQSINSKPADRSRTLSKTSTNTKMETKIGKEPVRHTDFAMTDAQGGRGSLQQPTTTARTGLAMGRRLQKLARPKRSASNEQKYIGDELRGPTTRPKSSYDPIVSTEYSLRRPKEYATHSSTAEPTVNTVIKPTLRRRGSDSSESSFVRSRSIGSPRSGFRSSMRSSSFDSKPSLSGNGGRNRLTLRSLSPTTSHQRHHSAAPAAPSRHLVENPKRQPFQRHSIAPRISQSLSRRDEDSTYGDHISDSSDDDMNTTPLTNGSITGDEYEPVHSRLKQSILNMYARNNLPDQNSSASAGFNSGLPKHDAPKPKVDQYHNEENPRTPLDQLSGASPRRPGLISTLRRKSHANVKESSDADTARNTLPHHHSEDATSTRNSVIPNHATGWPLQNRKGETNEASMTSPFGDTGRRSAASGSIVKDDLTSEPRHQHELQLYEGSSDAHHANTLPSQEPKRKKFNSLRKMFKIN